MYVEAMVNVFTRDTNILHTKFKYMVLMYKIYNNVMPSNILSYFCMVHMTHDHDTRQAGHFKNVYSRTTLTSA